MAAEQTLTERLVAQLEAAGATFRLVTHEPVTTSEEAARVRGTQPQQGAKALVFRADKQPILLVLPGNRRVDSRAFKQAHSISNLKMVSADELRELTGMEVGAVPPFGNLMGLPTYVDERLLDLSQIAFNAGSRSTSIIMDVADYERVAAPIRSRFASGE